MVCEQSQKISRSARRAKVVVMERWSGSGKRTIRGGGPNGYIGLDPARRSHGLERAVEGDGCSIRSRRRDSATRRGLLWLPVLVLHCASFEAGGFSGSEGD